MLDGHGRVAAVRPSGPCHQVKVTGRDFGPAELSGRRELRARSRLGNKSARARNLRRPHFLYDWCKSMNRCKRCRGRHFAGSAPDAQMRQLEPLRTSVPRGDRYSYDAVSGNTWTCRRQDGSDNGIGCWTTLLDGAMSVAVYFRVSTGNNLSISNTMSSQPLAHSDRVFTDTASGRAGSDRPGWSECMGWLREGDHLVVAAVDRLGRSVREVAAALYELAARGCTCQITPGRCGHQHPTGRAVVSIMATIAELELELGKERRAASREARVARGLAATKPMKLNAAQQKRLLRLYQQGEPVSELIRCSASAGARSSGR